MSDYSKTTDFTTKDTLPSGNAAKTIKGSDFDLEFNAIVASSATKANKIAAATNNNLVTMDGNGDIKDSTIVTDGAGGITANLTGNVTGNSDTVTTNANLTGGVTSVGNAATVVTNANLTGPVTSVGNATAIANDAVGSAQIAADAVGTSEIASGGVRFNDEIALGTASGTWAVNNTTGTTVPRGVYNFYVTGAGAINIQVQIGGGWRSVVPVINSGEAGQVVSDGTNVRLFSTAGSQNTDYDEIFD